MNDLTVNQHKQGSKGPCNFYIITISTSRSAKYGDTSSPLDAEDRSGQLMEEMILTAGHKLSGYSLISDNKGAILDTVTNALRSGADIVVTSGGTGLTSKDVTIESVVPMFEKNIQGFGELFRYKSMAQIGVSVILTRACAGVVAGKAVFCLPGSPAAVELALKEIIIPEAGHIVRHVRE
ncbi:MogA/MoaB family molybdenum cofactor biosynthesis protein [Methanolobus halotolerans]|uniref:Molybdenum cofactor biosynthesis protein n=1 Tax=Methanolobus halotolerans TaxID=2052935 RepID=A0A4E0R1P6_9EURY|nr:molybdenum cofactor biosynthesis protein B [Methanolobus halotolerans]TGC11109.1 molybdenum cofactor biosynthesis protein [Methanolobus halotolerans]